MTEHRSPIPARVYNAAVGGHVCGPEDLDFGQKVVHLVKYDRGGNEVSFESQVTQANKIYVIHDDFVLSSNLTIPANCILKFDGGSISGAHTITGQNTGIEAGLVKIFGTDITLEGSWKVEGWNVEWFGANIQNEDNSSFINFAINQIHNINGGNLYINNVYDIKHSLYWKGRVSIIGKSAISFSYNNPNNTNKLAAGFIYKGNDTNIWIVDYHEAGTLTYNTVFSTYTPTDGSMDGCCIKNLFIVSSINNVFGGLRINNGINRIVENVYIAGVKFGISQNNGWETYYLNTKIVASLGCLVLGANSTINNISSCSFIGGHAYWGEMTDGSTITGSIVGGDYLPPYIESPAPVGIIGISSSKGGRTVIYGSTFENLTCGIGTFGDEVLLYGCYFEKVVGTLAYTRSGYVLVDNPIVHLPADGEIMFGTFEGSIEANNALLSTCWHHTTNDRWPKYTINVSRGDLPIQVYDSYEESGVSFSNLVIARGKIINILTKDVDIKNSPSDYNNIPHEVLLATYGTNFEGLALQSHDVYKGKECFIGTNNIFANFTNVSDVLEDVTLKFLNATRAQFFGFKINNVIIDGSLELQNVELPDGVHANVVVYGGENEIHIERNSGLTTYFLEFENDSPTIVHVYNPIGNASHIPNMVYNPSHTAPYKVFYHHLQGVTYFTNTVRPTVGVPIGYKYFDNNLTTPRYIWYRGKDANNQDVWVDATGATV